MAGRNYDHVAVAQSITQLNENESNDGVFVWF